MEKNFSFLSFAAGLALSITPMCAKADSTSQNGTQSLSDAQISQIVMSANNGEIQQAELAKKQSTNSAVRGFAQMMIKQHQDVNQKLSAVDLSESIRPESSDASQSLEHNAQQTLAQLQGLQGPDFDRSYVDAQVKAHQAVLDDIDHKLMPNAKDAKLQAMLKKTRPAVAMHLDHAKRLQAMLSQGSAPRSS